MIVHGIRLTVLTSRQVARTSHPGLLQHSKSAIASRHGTRSNRIPANLVEENSSSSISDQEQVVLIILERILLCVLHTVCALSLGSFSLFPLSFQELNRKSVGTCTFVIALLADTLELPDRPRSRYRARDISSFDDIYRSGDTVLEECLLAQTKLGWTVVGEHWFRVSVD